jgi:hypothetical protein
MTARCTLAPAGREHRHTTPTDSTHARKGPMACVLDCLTRGTHDEMKAATTHVNAEPGNRLCTGGRYDHGRMCRQRLHSNAKQHRVRRGTAKRNSSGAQCAAGRHPHTSHPQLPRKAAHEHQRFAPRTEDNKGKPELQTTVRKLCSRTQRCRQIAEDIYVQQRT